MSDSSPPDGTSADLPQAQAWPRGLQVFALVAFVTNLAAAAYLVH